MITTTTTTKHRYGFI